MAGRRNEGSTAVVSREAEIDDLLSSIRRITADALGEPTENGASAGLGAPRALPVGAGNGALVLGPALRVSGGGQTGPEPRPPSAEALGKSGDRSGSMDAEERLRAIVSEIVREELRGALGRDITRGVRKLVRREINRLMASRDLR